MAKDHHHHHDQHDFADAVALHYVLPAIQVSSAVLIIIFMAIYCTKYDEIPSKTPFYVAVTLFCAQAAYLFAHAARDVWFHETRILDIYLKTVAFCLFAIQYHILLFLFFDRLQRAFKGQSQVSRRTVIIFYVILTTYAILEICTITLSKMDLLGRDSLLSMECITFFFVLVLVCLPIFVFAHKLLKLIGTRQDTGLMSVLTRVTLLASICAASLIVIFVVIMVAIHMVHRGELSEDDFEILLALCLCFDTWINFGSVILAFQCFNKMYLILCGCADRQCLKLCDAIVRTRKMAMMTAATAPTTNNNNNGGGGDNVELSTIEVVMDSSPQRTTSKKEVETAR